MLAVGSVIDGKYKILSEIGRGSMSIVYLAINERANKKWAVKEMRTDSPVDDVLLRRSLAAEAEILKRLNHPHLPAIADVIDDADTVLIVMDYIEGKDLQYWLSREGPQMSASVIDWGIQICGILSYLHSRTPPVLYRDLKPSNLMLKPDGQIMLIDFGAACEQHADEAGGAAALGTPGYAPPEQYDPASKTDARTDIYAFGATMHHLLTGRAPGVSASENRAQRARCPQIPPALNQIIDTCMQADPDMRYQNSARLLDALEHCTDDTRRVSGDRKTAGRKRRRIRRALAAAAAVFFLSAISGVRSSAGQSAEISDVSSASYETLLEEAQKTADEAEKYAFYQAAVTQSPGAAQAYLDLLDHYVTEDLIFDSSEYSDLRSLLKQSADGISNEAAFQMQSPEAYTEFCYRTGVYLYYYYEGENHSVCLSWFAQVCESDENLISEKKRRIAGRLQQMEQYAFLLAEEKDLSGLKSVQEETGSYADYWVLLTELMEDLYTVTNEASSDDAVDPATAVTIYRVFLEDVGTYAADFQEDGISEAQMYDQIALAQTGLSDLMQMGALNDSVEEADLAALAVHAKEAVCRVFEGTGAMKSQQTQAEGEEE